MNNVNNKIDLLIESALQYEERYLIEMDNNTFEKMPPKTGTDFRKDWYFPTHRIRQISQRGKMDWQNISQGQATKAVKTKTSIPPQNISKLNEDADIYYHVIGKRPVIDGTECYLEKVILPDGSFFYTTEVESTEDIEDLKKLKTVVKSLKKIGATSLRDIALGKMKKS